MKGLVFILALLLVFTPVLTGCSYTPPFEDIDWVMEAYGEPENLKTALPDVEVNLYFDSTKGEFIGSTGCNAYSGNYEIDGSNLSFPNGVAQTMLKCEGEVGQQEIKYLHTFSTADSLEIVDNKLHIACGGELIIYHKK